MSLLVALGLLSLATPTTPDVLVVDTGGPAGSFRTIQEAVDAADDGDTVLVADPEEINLHVDGFVLDGKGLQIVAHVGTVNRIRASIVRNVPAGSQVLLQGLAFQSVTSHTMPLRPFASPAWDAGAQGPGLTIEGCVDKSSKLPFLRAVGALRGGITVREGRYRSREPDPEAITARESPLIVLSWRPVG